VEGLVTVCCAGSCSTKDGYAIHIYTATEDMVDCCLCNADGDFLIVPQQGMCRRSGVVSDLLFFSNYVPAASNLAVASDIHEGRSIQVGARKNDSFALCYQRLRSC
jgi:hypothetical protein